MTTGSRRAGWTVLLAALALSGCAALNVTLRDLIDRGAGQEAAEKGQKWLDKNASDPKEAAQRAEISLLVAEARLQVARKTDTVEAYRGFRQAYAWDPAAARLRDEALRFESMAFFRDDTRKRNDVTACQQFRKQYPDAPDTGESWRLEAEIALAAAEAEGSVSALKGFRATYQGRAEARPFVDRARVRQVDLAFKGIQGDASAAQVRLFRSEYEEWPEAADRIGPVRVREVQLSFDQAVRADTFEAFADFRSRYADWPEAATLEPQAYEREAAHALRRAVAAQDLSPLVAFRARYTREPWPGRANEAVADYHLGRMRFALANGGALDDSDVDALVSVLDQEPLVRTRAKADQANLLQQANRLRSGPMHFLYVRLFPDDPRSRAGWKTGASLYWAEVNAADTPEKWLRYVRWFPDTREAHVAEQRYQWHLELARKDAFGLHATVTRVLRHPSGEVDLYVDVRDRKGNRVSGLTLDGFRLFEGSQKVDIRGFWGMEEERPLDILFAVDMSGSMRIEREAVRRAIQHFASMLDFRGRQSRMGLLSFSEALMDVHAPVAGTRHFVEWMSNLHDAAGGAGEDGVLALAEASDMMRQSEGERVVIYLSDEDLQINAGGRARLHLPEIGRCGKGRQILTCVTRCDQRSGSDPSCRASCLQGLGPDVPRLLSKCARRTPMARCVRDGYWNRRINAMNQGCGEPILSQGDREMERLLDLMRSRQVRPFLLVTNPVLQRGTAYRALAQATQGTILTVPDDARNPEPYMQALMEIAEQLSRQYVLRYRPTNGAAGAALAQVLVRPIHRWNEFGTVEENDIKALVGGGEGADCPDLLLASLSGLHRSQRCGTAWELVPTGLEGPLRDAAAAGDRVLALSEAGLLVVHSLETGKTTPVPVEAAGILRVAWEGEQAFWVVGRDDGGAIVLERRDATGESRRRLQITHPMASAKAVGRNVPILLPGAAMDQGRVCLLVGPDRMVCATGQAGGEADFAVTGLPASCLGAGASARFLADNAGILLLAGSDGALYRSINAGRHWTRVLDPSPEPRRLVSIPTSPALLCAVSAKDVMCSEDTGIGFFPLGLPGDRPGATALAVVKGQPVLAMGGRLNRLFRVLNRELPSSAVYFGTNQDDPSDEMLPFLRQLAEELARNPTAHLRVEGHADKRGSSEHNEALALRRAQAVARMLVQMGADESRLLVVSMGESRPVQAGDSPRALARNRRVELLLLQKPPAGWFESASR